MYVGLKQPRGDGERCVTPDRAAANETRWNITQNPIQSLEKIMFNSPGKYQNKPANAFLTVSSSSNLHILCFLLSATNFGIVEPFPENIYPIEFTSAEVTCVAFDSLGEKTPEKILFMRKDQFATYTEIKANDSLGIYFTNRTERVVVGVGEGRYLPLKMYEK